MAERRKPQRKTAKRSAKPRSAQGARAGRTAAPTARAKPTPKPASTARAKSTRKPAPPARAKAQARRREEPVSIPIAGAGDDRYRVPPKDPPNHAPHAEHAHGGEAPRVSPFQPGFAPECMACPICMLFYVVKNTKPEAMEHFMKAAFEVMQAGKALFEQYSERWDQAEKLERITIS